MRSLLDHRSDGESADKLGLVLSNAIWAAIAIGVIAWLFGIRIP
jgi:hypothetical protein